MGNKKRFSVEEAAAEMGMSPMFLRMGLRQDKFPFGRAVMMEKQWRYYINEAQFRAWMSGLNVN